MAFGKFTLLSNASATGSATAWPGGRGTFTVVGTWGGGAVKLQTLGPDGTTYVDVDTANATFSANGICGVELAPTMVRAAVTGTASALYATLSGLGD